MNNRYKTANPTTGDGGISQNNKQTRIDASIPQSPTVSSIPQTIPTSAGGPVHWAVCDALFTLRDELEAIGLDCPHDAIAASWAKMLTASYIPAEELATVEVEQ